MNKITEEFGLNSHAPPSDLQLKSVNEESLINYLKTSDSECIIINGTRVISKIQLEKINLPMINIHTGITPKYRGIHGGYWAIRNGDVENFGSTIHFVDSGIDTGNVIKHILSSPTADDNYCTYPFLQYGIAIPILTEIINNGVLNATIFEVDKENSESKLYYHPGITDYVLGLFHGKK